MEASHRGGKPTGRRNLSGAVSISNRIKRSGPCNDRHQTERMVMANQAEH